MNIKKYLVGGGLAATLLIGAASLVLAEEMMEKKMEKMEKSMEAMSRPKPMILEITPAGRLLLRGDITEVVSTSPLVLKVKTWGGEWTVNDSGSTEIMPNPGDVSQFAVGHYVGVKGTGNQTDKSVTADLVRDWTAKKLERENREIMRKERKNNQEEIREVIKRESPKNWDGIVSNIGTDGKSFGLKVDGIDYQIEVVTDAKVVKQDFSNGSLTDIKEGDRFRVWGPVSGTTISAYVVRGPIAAKP